MSKICLTVSVVLLLILRACGENAGESSAEQLREIEIDELIRSLEARINAKEANSREAYNVAADVEGDSRGAKEQTCDREDVFRDRGDDADHHVHPNPRDRKAVIGEGTRPIASIKAGIPATQADYDVRARLDKRKIADSDIDLDELRREAYGLRGERTLSLGDGPAQRNQLSDFEKDEQYYRALLRLQNLYRLYNKRYNLEPSDPELLGVGGNDDRTSRHCTGDLLSKKLDFIQASKLRYLERSRLLADRIAESAMHLVRKKGRILDHLRSGCGCAPSCLGSALVVPEPVFVQPVMTLEEATKRDVEVSAASSASAAVDTSVSAGGVSVDAAVDANVASAASLSAGAGGVGASVSSAAGVSSDLQVAAGGGIGGRVSAGTSLSAGVESHLNVGLGAGKAAGYKGVGLLVGQLSTCEDYERKMIMDMAIEEAAGMIRKLAQETRSEVGYRDDPDFERRVLGLAIDLVNKVTEGVTGDVGKLDMLTGYKYNSVDDYLKASIYEGETEADMLSNAGFDYVNQDLSKYRDLMDGRRLYDNQDTFDDYVGHPSPYSRGRCDSCSKYDLRLGNMCPLCKRSGNVFHGRVKRKPSEGTGKKGKIHHLEESTEVPRKRSRSGGVWEDVNKLYNFNDLENDKFIDLSMNCSENSTKPDCQRLYFELVTPKDGEPVPLWFVRDYLSQGRDLAVDMHERARGLQSGEEGLRPQPHSASMLHFLNNRVSDSLVRLNEESQLVLFGTKVLQQKLLTEYNITPNTFLEFLRHHGFRVTGSQICRDRQKRCNSQAKFRSIEGSCNNFRNPSWGQSNTAFVRILPARYSDGIYALPVSVTGKPLPNPRALSAQLFSRRNATDSLFTLALMQWGQVIAHDFARQVIDQTVEGGIECCDPSGSGPLPRSMQHHSCSPIVIPASDSFYARYGQACMNFVRSMTVAREDCSLGPADQLNGVSSFLDLSPVYGADRATSDSLREFQGGRMRTEYRRDRIMMPTSTRSGFCDARTSWDICFETGDARTNQNPQLVILQTLLIREHNRIAYELSALNPHWNDERLFQESRQIVIAEYQHITYRHWLPHILGKGYCLEHHISPPHNGLSYDYDVKINPGTINSFTSGAFRFLHTMIEGNINLVADNYGTSNSLRLSNYYFRPQIVEPNNNFEALLRGLIYQTMQKPDANFHEEVTEYLFRSGNDYGMDLEAIDIQRGRDHGIPGYNAYREICSLGRADDFHGLINEISLNHIEKLQSIYEHVEDIDLLVGATMETRLPGSLLGPTLQCLIGEQFYRSRVGDKYFYNNADFPHSFTPEQFEEIKKASLATLICELGEAMYEVQRDPFKVNSYRNPLVKCFNLPKMNLEYWKEEIFL